MSQYPMQTNEPKNASLDSNETNKTNYELIKSINKLGSMLEAILKELRSLGEIRHSLDKLTSRVGK